MSKKLLLLLLLSLLVIAACRPTVASAPAEINNQETSPAQVVTPKSPVNSSVDVDPRNWPKPDNKPPVLPPPFRDKPSAALDEELAWRKEMADKGFISSGPPAMGPHRKGATITVKGLDIKLPDDAYPAGVVVFEEIPINMPAKSEAPYLVIERGKSRIFVKTDSGKIVGEQIVPGEEGSFDFLKRALQ